MESLEDRRLLATIRVTTTADTVDANDGLVSLREAITIANQNGDSEVDEIELGAGVYLLTRVGVDDENEYGDLDIHTPLVIRGAGQAVTAIDAGGEAGIGSRVLQTSESYSLTIQDMTIRGGRAQGHGGGIAADRGDVIVVRSVVTGNKTTGAHRSGGGISARSGDLVLEDSVVSFNEVKGERALGGGLFSFIGDVALTNSTVYGNRTDGRFSPGGGISAKSGSLVLTGSTVYGNEAKGWSSYGGGIYLKEGSLTVETSSISDNRTSGGESCGGGIFITSGTAMVSGSEVIGNSTQGDRSGGGGICSSNSGLRLEGSVVSGNSNSGRVGDGGGILAKGSVTVIRSTISDNLVTGEDAKGGGIAVDRGSLTLRSSTVSGNSTAEGASVGGGISGTDGSIALFNSTVSGNTSRLSGGGLSAGDSDLEIVNSTIAGNTANGVGGGLASGGYNPRRTIQNSIIAGNVGDDRWPDIYDISDFASTRMQNSLIGFLGESPGRTPGDLHGFQDGEQGNIIGVDWRLVLENDLFNPILKDNGGPTESIQLLSNWRDGEDRDAINGGSNRLAKDAAGNDLVFDQRGNVDRILDGRVDMGAVEQNQEVEGPTFGAETFVVTSLGDSITPSDSEVTLREAIIAANLTEGHQTIDASSINGTITLALGQLEIRDDVTIAGPTDGSLIIDADQKSRVLNIEGDAVDVNLAFLTLTRGLTQDDSLSPIPNLYEFAGGGIRFHSKGRLTINRSTISENRTTGELAEGGGVFSVFGEVILENSVLSGNSTANGDAKGGGISIVDGSVTIRNSTIAGNSTAASDSFGGGLSASNSTVQILNATITNNSSNSQGGGVSSYIIDPNRTFVVQNSIIAGNQGNVTAPDLIVPVRNVDIRSSLIGNTHGTRDTVANGIDGNIVGVDWKKILENDGTSPILKDNGGPTHTIALIANPDDPLRDAIDAGSNELAVDGDGNPLLLDQRGDGFDRFRLGEFGFANIVDMGAMELVVPGITDFDKSDLVVTSTVDVLDLDDDLVTLRDAIEVANLVPGHQTIDATRVSGTVALAAGQLEITDSLTINGPELGNLTIDAEQNSRVVNIEGDSVDVDLSNLKIIGGRTSVTNELIDDEVETTHSGGGIRFVSGGELHLDRVTVAGNQTDGQRATGGGIFVSEGVLIATNSTLSGNVTRGAVAHGGAVHVRGGGGVLTNTTVANNQTEGTGSNGGGLATSESTVEIRNTTIVGNHAASDGGGIRSGFTSPLVSFNSIIAGNTSDGSSPDLNPPGNPAQRLEVKSSLIGNSAGTEGSLVDGVDGNQIGVDWKNVIENDGVAALLKNNGGPTDTVALVPGGPAVNAGNNSLARDSTGNLLPSDQRGFSVRRFGGKVDIGAFERFKLNSDDFVVTSTDDTLLLANNAVTLRDAIYAAAITDGEQTIDATGVSGSVKLKLGSLDIAEGITIRGPGDARLAIDADGKSRVINVSTGSFDVVISGMTVTGGLTTGQSQRGGGISFASSGTLTLDEVTVSNNRTTGRKAQGGGIRITSGRLVLIDSQVTDNTTTGQFADGGGITATSGDITLSNSVVSGNRTSGQNADGGGIYATSGEVTMTASSVSENEVSGAKAAGNGIVSIRGEILVTDGPLWRMGQPIIINGEFVASADNSSSGGNQTIEAIVPNPWKNFLQPGDVDNDGVVQASDALRIINELARRAYSESESAEMHDPRSMDEWPGLYFDRNGDGKATALDALQIVNELARQNVSSTPADSHDASTVNTNSSADEMNPNRVIPTLSHQDRWVKQLVLSTDRVNIINVENPIEDPIDIPETPTTAIDLAFAILESAPELDSSYIYPLLELDLEELLAVHSMIFNGNRFQLSTE